MGHEILEGIIVKEIIPFRSKPFVNTDDDCVCIRIYTRKNSSLHKEISNIYENQLSLFLDE